MYPENSSFSPELPTLQVAWDSTSYKTFLTCPFKYYLKNVLGYQSRRKSVHLTFGIAFHDACETFHRLRAEGMNYEDALETVIARVYYRQLKTPEEKHRGLGYHEDALPEGETTKTPETLLRTLVWYFDQFGVDDPAKTHILSNGKPAVELSFSFPIDDQFSYCGHFDRIVEFNDALWDSDYKTTKSQLNAMYFAQWTPDIQMTGYTLASKIVFDVPAKGVIVDAVQLGVTFSRFARNPVHRTAEQLDEFISDLELSLQIAKVYAEKESWPQNPESCHHYGGCEFRKVCSHSPSVRKNFLEADFKIRHWDPSKER